MLLSVAPEKSKASPASVGNAGERDTDGPPSRSSNASSGMLMEMSCESVFVSCAKIVAAEVKNNTVNVITAKVFIVL